MFAVTLAADAPEAKRDWFNLDVLAIVGQDTEQDTNNRQGDPRVARPVIITCALAGGAPMSDKIRVPVSPAEIAQAAIGAAKAGAAIVHIHVRDPATGQPSMKVELYEETVARIKDSGVDVVINLTTGPGAHFVPGDPDPAVGGAGTTLKSPAARVSHIERLKPEVCSLDVAA